MVHENLIFTTARGSQIPLQYPISWEAIFPALDACNYTENLKNDNRFEYIGEKNIQYEHTFIVHYYVKINDGSEFQDKKCCLSLVTAMIRGEARTALIPEKCEHNCCDNFK